MLAQKRTLLAALPVLSFLSACGVDHMGNHDASAIADSVQSMRVEVGRHRDAITGAVSLTDVPPETERHDRAVADITHIMNTTMDGMMSHCSGSGMGMMHDRIGSIGSEMQSDREAMLNAQTLADARAECTAHSHRMSGMLDDMQGALGSFGCAMMDR